MVAAPYNTVPRSLYGAMVAALSLLAVLPETWNAVTNAVVAGWPHTLLSPFVLGYGCERLWGLWGVVMGCGDGGVAL